MCWNEFLNTNRIRKSQVDDRRTDLSGSTDNRNPFESDFGRVIFSSACRRLHDKTQVFPLTSDDNIHSRLTHSLEVMNIGLSFGIYLCGNEKFKETTGLTSEDILRKISPILKTACLVHDIGNPPFGHFGEEVIQEYFKNLFFSLMNKTNPESELSKHIYKGICDTVYCKDNEDIQKKCVEKQITELSDFLSNPQLKYDYTQFDGNAEGFRILTKLQYLGDLEGLNLTFATLASILKYPNYNEGNKEDGNIGNHKHGAFFTEKAGYIGTLVPDHILAGMHGYNAHDYRAESLADFFTLAEKTDFPLNEKEHLLKEILLHNGIILPSDSGVGYKPGQGAVISISQESPLYLRYTFIAHEGFHGIYFSDETFRNAVAEVYNTADKKSIQFLQNYFVSKPTLNYNIDDTYLMQNEFMAYIMQQSVANTGPYFADNLAHRNSMKYYFPEDAAYVQQTKGTGFTEASLRLSTYTFNRWGIEAGRVSLVGR